MILNLYNSLSHQVESVPKKTHANKTVKVYCCGVTVYDHCHLGHGRVFVISDMIVRVLQALDYNVIFARNITDIDDKIINKSKELKCSWLDLTKEITLSMQKDAQKLGCLEPAHEPRATEAIGTITDMISELIQKDYAYELNGDVYFSIKKFSSYGQLSGQRLEELELGHRVQTDDTKNHPADFVLWKKSKEHEPSWSSPWGDGRPGWHIECSAMIESILEGTIDLHLGGMDLKFPHHENEIAQTEACKGHKLSDHWSHIGFVTVDQEKMAKSIGNFVYLNELLNEFSGDVLRYFYLTTHYKQPLQFTREKMEQAVQSVRRLKNYLEDAELASDCLEDAKALELKTFLLAPLCDDLNTPLFLHNIFHVMKNNSTTPGFKLFLKNFMKEVCGFSFRDTNQQEELPTSVVQLLNDRQEAKLQKNFALADSLRRQIEVLGYRIVDTKQGVECTREKN